MRGKKPLSENEVKSLRKLLEENPLHSLLLNIGVDTMFVEVIYLISKFRI